MAQRLRELYLAAFAREPRSDEVQAAEAYLAEPRLAELQAFLVTTGLRALEKEAGLS